MRSLAESFESNRHRWEWLFRSCSYKHQDNLHRIAVRDRPTQRTCIFLGRLRTTGSLSIFLGRAIHRLTCWESHRRSIAVQWNGELTALKLGDRSGSRSWSWWAGRYAGLMQDMAEAKWWLHMCGNPSKLVKYSDPFLPNGLESRQGWPKCTWEELLRSRVPSMHNQVSFLHALRNSKIRFSCNAALKPSRKIPHVSLTIKVVGSVSCRIALKRSRKIPYISTSIEVVKSVSCMSNQPRYRKVV